RNILMALLERPGSTMHDIIRVITDQKFRTELTRSIRNESVKRFFEKEYGGFSFGYRSDGTAPIQNKVGAFLTDPGLNRIVTGSKQEVRVRQIMDEGKVLLVNWQKAKLARIVLPCSEVCWSQPLDLPRSAERMPPPGIGETSLSMCRLNLLL